MGKPRPSYDNKNPNFAKGSDGNFIDTNVITTRESRSEALGRWRKNNGKIDKSIREWLKLYCTDYRILGYNAREIVDFMDRDFGMSIASRTVYKYINEVLDDWREYTSGNLHRRRQLELSKIDKLERTYWEAWENSKENKNGLTIEEDELFDDEEGDYKQHARRRKTRQNEYAGDSQFLKGIEWCISMRCKLLGLTDEKLLVSFSSNPINHKIDIENLDTDLLKKIKDAYTEVDNSQVGSNKHQYNAYGIENVPNKKKILEAKEVDSSDDE